jgi:hypothetical protein
MSETVADTLTRLQAFCLEQNPNADIAPGTVLNELVLKLAATLQNPIYNDILALDQGNSVKTALESITPTNTAIIDEVASNFLTTRSQGQISTGVLQVTVSIGNRGYVVKSGSTFVQPSLGLQYVTTQDYTFGNLSTNLPLYSNNGVFYFLLPVQAAAAGSQYQVSSGTAFSVVAPTSISNLVSIAAYGSFTTGLPVQSDQQLIAGMKGNLTNISLTSARAIAATLSSDFPAFQTLSAVGANDIEMLRSKRNAFGVSTFGKADVYVRTSLASETTTVTKTGTKISNATTSSPAIWQVSMAATDVPAFYRVVSVLPTPTGTQAVGGTLVVNSTTFGYDPDQFTHNNEVGQELDARFSSYQTAVINFQYAELPTLTVGSTANFDITVSYQPNIRDIQSMFQDPSSRPLCGDYLIKAALPCYVSMNITIVRNSITDTAASIGISKMQQDIFTYVNTIPFGQSLNISKIIDICHNYPIKRVDLPLLVNGQIYTTTGSSINISSTDDLTIPVNVAEGVSPNTTLYFIDYFTQAANGTTSTTNIGINLV